MNLQTKTFDYSTLDKSTESILREKEMKVNETANRAFTEIGKELKEAQEILSKNGYGCFIEWCESIGFKKDKAYALINRYDLIVGNSDKQDLIESLPLSLSYEVSKKSTLPEIKQKVLDGEVTSLRELRQVEAAYKEAERRAQEAESRAVHYEKLWNQTKNQPPKVVTQTVEKVPDDYRELKQQANQVQQLNNENVQLKRTIMEQREMMGKQEKSDQALRELKKSLADLLRNVSMNHETAVFYFNELNGNRDAHITITNFLTQYSEMCTKQFEEWKSLTAIKAVN